MSQRVIWRARWKDLPVVLGAYTMESAAFRSGFEAPIVPEKYFLEVDGEDCTQDIPGLVTAGNDQEAVALVRGVMAEAPPVN